MQPVVRVCILRCTPDKFAKITQMMIEAEQGLRPGVESMRGLLAFYAGADEMTSSLTNVSVWVDLDAAKQLDRFQPMLDLGKQFVAKGVTFERPIMNYTTLWQIQPLSGNCGSPQFAFLLLAANIRAVPFSSVCALATPRQ